MRIYHQHVYNIKKIIPEKLGNKAILISLIMGFYMLGWGFVNPIFSIYLNQIISSNILVGLVFGLNALLGIVLSLPIGRLIDRVNKIKLLTLSLLAYMFIVFGYIVSWFNHSVIFIVRILHGVMILFVWITSEAILRHSSKDIEHAFSFYLFTQKFMTVVGGIGLISLLYFQIITIENLFLTFLFLLALIISAAMLTPFFFATKQIWNNNLIGKSCKLIRKDRFMLNEIRDISQFGRNVHMMMIIRFVQDMFVTAIAIFFPIMIFKLNYPLWQIVGIALIPELLFILLPRIPKLARKYGDLKLLTILTITAGGAGIGITLFENLIGFIILYSICIGSIFLSSPIINKLITKNVNKKDYGELTGGLTLASKVGILIGGIGAGYLADVATYEITFITFSVTLIIISLVTLLYYKIKGD